MRVAAPTVRALPFALLLTIGIVAPYSNLLRLDQVLLTDDMIVSDTFDSELPTRAWVGAHPGQRWNPQVFAGAPVPNGNDTPLSAALYRGLPAAAAEDLFVLAGLLLAGFGAWRFAAALGASPVGALLAGLAYAHSGYMVMRAQHSNLFEIAAVLPWAFWATERIARPAPGYPPTRARLAAGLALSAAFAWQILAAFPQVAYYSGLACAAWLALRAPTGGRRSSALVALGAVCVAALVGAPGFLPLLALSTNSTRSGSWALSDLPTEVFAPARIVGILSPSLAREWTPLFGAVGSYGEDYIYLGVLPFWLAVGALARWRRPEVRGLWAVGGVAYVFGLGLNTPFYALAWRIVPGLNRFRFPTRALCVTDLALAVLAGLGLTLAEEAYRTWRKGRASLPRAELLSGLLVAVTLADLWVEQVPQNPWGNAGTWLAPPDTAAFLQKPGNEGRFFSLSPRVWHLDAVTKHGATFTERLAHRALLAPNTGLYWGLAGSQMYSGIAVAWSHDFWSGVSGPGLVDNSVVLDRAAGVEVASRAFARLLALGHVRWVLSHTPIVAADGADLGLRLAWRGEYAGIYEVVDPMPRAWVVPTLTPLADDAQVLEQLAGGVDARETALVLAADVGEQPAGIAGPAQVTADGGDSLDIDATGPGTLIVADGYYPGWVAEVDGVETETWRANHWQRAVPLPAGPHHVHMAFALPRLAESERAQLVGAVVWLVGAAGLAIAAIRGRLRVTRSAE